MASEDSALRGASDDETPSSGDAYALCCELRAEDPEVYAQAMAILSAIVERVRARRRHGLLGPSVRAAA